MNMLEKLMKILEKSRQGLLFSQEDKNIIKEISQCNNSYYKMRILDILKYELEDWSYDILKPMIKDKNRLVAEKAVFIVATFIKLKDFYELFRKTINDEFINYASVEAMAYIGKERRIDEDIIEKQVRQMLSEVAETSCAIYRIHAYMFDLTDDEIYIDNILNGLQSKNDDERYQALYTTDYIINENRLETENLLDKIDKKLRDSMENEQRYNRIYRERLINLIREKSGKEREIIYDQEKIFHQKVLNDPKYILQRCIFELYYPINDDPYKIVLNLLEENRGKTQEEEFYIFGSYIESIYGWEEVNVYQQWLEARGSKKNKAIILYLKAMWEFVKDDYNLLNKRALKYANEALTYAKDIPAIYHLIGRLTSPDTVEYENLKKACEENTIKLSLQEIENMKLEELYSYDTFLKMDILKKFAKPENFSLIALENEDDDFWNWEL